MKRARTIAAIVLAALLGAVLPVLTVAYFSWLRQQELEQRTLASTAERTLQRAHRAYEAGLTALRQAKETLEASASHLMILYTQQAGDASDSGDPNL